MEIQIRQVNTSKSSANRFVDKLPSPERIVNTVSVAGFLGFGYLLLNAETMNLAIAGAWVWTNMTMAAKYAVNKKNPKKEKD